MKARGVEIGTNKVVEGYHCEIRGKHYIILNSAKIFVHHYIPTSNPLDGEGISGFVEIYPDSLALDTGRTDRRGKEIYGSYPVNGAMSKGGDRVKIRHSKWPAFQKTQAFAEIQWRDVFSRWMAFEFIESSNKTGQRILTDLSTYYKADFEIIGTQWEAPK